MGKPFLPEWRYWPAIPLVLLILIAALGSLSIHPPRKQLTATASDHTSQNVDRRSPEERIADYELWLERFTGLLVVLSALEIWLLFKADGIANAQGRIALWQLRYSKQQRDIIAAQSDILEKQKEIARIQYFSEHRPKLIVAFVRRMPFDAGVASDTQPIKVQFAVINTGSSDANFVGGRVKLEWQLEEDIPNPDDLTGQDLNLRAWFAPSGRDRAVAATGQDGGFQEANGAEDAGKYLFLMGWIIYADGRGVEFGNVRTTYFCLRYDSQRELFRPYTDIPDWNSSY